jgi:AcrR family transcriptional regulator
MRAPLATPATRTTRPRDANASREALLSSARILFSERGFEQTTVRDIGDHSGVDPALIARYYGSKVKLYLATVTAEDGDSGRPKDFSDPRAYVQWLVARVDARGPGPVLQAILRSDTTAEIREATGEHLARRMVEPLAIALETKGIAHPRQRAEMAVSALIGLLLGRALGSFPELAAASQEQFVDLLVQVLPDLS